MKRNAFLLAVLFMVFFICALCGVRYGSFGMDTKTFFGALVGKDGLETQTVILYSVRLPRVLAGALAGIGLSVSGMLLQSVTDNGLAGPNIIGVNAGAGLAVILLLAFFPMAAEFLPWAAALGAFAATAVILGVSGSLGASKSSLILAGVALTALLNAAIHAISLVFDGVLSSYNAFSVGGLSGVSIKRLALPAVLILLGLLAALLLSRRVALLCLGECSAAALGVNVRVLRMVCMVIASVLAGASVSFAGLVGFVGLVVPHMARKLIGGALVLQTVACALIGGTLVMLGDLLGRVLAAPSEIPVGITMSLLGAPFFLFLLWKKRYDV